MKGKHEHGVCSDASFETFIGCRVVGVLTNIKPGAHTLVFECGWGLTVNGNGAFWTEGPEAIKSAIEELRAELARAGAY